MISITRLCQAGGHALLAGQIVRSALMADGRMLNDGGNETAAPASRNGAQEERLPPTICRASRWRLSAAAFATEAETVAQAVTWNFLGRERVVEDV